MSRILCCARVTHNTNFLQETEFVLFVLQIGFAPPPPKANRRKQHTPLCQCLISARSRSASCHHLVYSSATPSATPTVSDIGCSPQLFKTNSHAFSKTKLLKRAVDVVTLFNCSQFCFKQCLKLLTKDVFCDVSNLIAIAVQRKTRYFADVYIQIACCGAINIGNRMAKG